MRAMIVALGLAAGVLGTAGEASAQFGYPGYGGFHPGFGYGYGRGPFYGGRYYAAPAFGYPAFGGFGYGGFPAYGYSGFPGYGYGGFPAFGGYGSGFRFGFSYGGFRY